MCCCSLSVAHSVDNDPVSGFKSMFLHPSKLRSDVFFPVLRALVWVGEELWLLLDNSRPDGVQLRSQSRELICSHRMCLFVRHILCQSSLCAAFSSWNSRSLDSPYGCADLRLWSWSSAAVHLFWACVWKLLRGIKIQSSCKLLAT